MICSMRDKFQTLLLVELWFARQNWVYKGHSLVSVANSLFKPRVDASCFAPFASKVGYPVVKKAS